jgi:hypothetical protein
VTKPNKENKMTHQNDYTFLKDLVEKDLKQYQNYSVS